MDNRDSPLSFHAFDQRRQIDVSHDTSSSNEIFTLDDVDDVSADDEANKMLSLVMWSLSLLPRNTGTVSTTTARKEAVQKKKNKAKKPRRPKNTILFPPVRLHGQEFLNPAVMYDFAMNPRRTMWYYVYILHPQVENARFQALFRRRFRVPYSSFLSMNADLENCPQFARWHSGKKSANGSLASPMLLLLLSVLRYLGRAWTIDDLTEATCISEEVTRVFLHQFLEYGSTDLYDQLVTSPTTHGEARTHVKEYEMAGFPGAVGSTDATHVLLERVNNRNRQAHLGFKSSHTARAYNITVNHRRQILSTTSGHPARWNDKTLQLFDPFMEQLHEGKILDDLVFQLYYLNAEGTVMKQSYRGGWLLVDNGYLSRSTTVPPIKTSNSRSEIRFSAWLESLRKDVECTFGILKGRWRILKSGIRLHGTSTPDKVFHTCCALHNLLLNVDGLNKEWNNGVPSDYATTALDDDDEIAGAVDDIPTALQRLANPVAARDNGIATVDAHRQELGELLRYPPSSTSTALVVNQPTTEIDGNEEGQDWDVLRQEDHGTAISVRSLSLDEFRRRLVVHFNIAFNRNEVQWPQRMGQCKELHSIQML